MRGNYEPLLAAKLPHRHHLVFLLTMYGKEVLPAKRGVRDPLGDNSITQAMVDVNDSKGRDMTLHPPRMQRASGQRLIFMDGKMIGHSTSETTGELSSNASSITDSSEQDIIKSKGFRSKLQTFKHRFDKLDQERRASRHLVQQSMQQQQPEPVQLSPSDTPNDNIHHMQIELLKKMKTKIDRMDEAITKDSSTTGKSSEDNSSRLLQLKQNELLEKMLYRLLNENEQLRATCREHEKNLSKFDAIMPEIDELISSVNHMQAENDKLQEENDNITLLLERMTDKVEKDDQEHEDCIEGYKAEIVTLKDKINQLENSEEELNWKLVKKLKKKKEEVAKLKVEINEAYHACEVLSKEVDMLKGGDTSTGLESEHHELDAIQEEDSLQDDDDSDDEGSEGLR